MKSKIIKRVALTRNFVQGDILEYAEENSNGIKIIVMFIAEKSSVTFRGVCLHVENCDGWTVAGVSDNIKYSSFKLFDGTLELSN